ncbi:MAG: ABC transporter permease [Candidatus Hodarchaeota archaeon]
MIQSPSNYSLGLTDLNKRSSLSAYIHMVKKELIIMIRYPVAFLSSFIQVFLILAIFTLAAFVFTGENSISKVEISGIMVYGLIIFLFVSEAFFTIGLSLRREQTTGTLESVYLTPANQFANLVSRISVAFVWSGLVSIFSIIFFSFVIGTVPIYNVLIGIFFLLFALSGTFGFGFMIAGLGIRLKETIELLANVAQFAVLILCAVFFPFSALPEPALWISKLIPISYAVDLFRSIMMGLPRGYPELASFEVEAIIVIFYGLLFPLFGYKYYQRQIRSAQDEGSLSNF